MCEQSHTSFILLRSWVRIAYYRLSALSLGTLTTMCITSLAKLLSSEIQLLPTCCIDLPIITFLTAASICANCTLLFPLGIIIPVLRIEEDGRKENNCLRRSSRRSLLCVPVNETSQNLFRTSQFIDVLKHLNIRLTANTSRFWNTLWHKNDVV
jgi:hypothetical protein